MKRPVGETIYDAICDDLRKCILNGEFKPGDRLKIAQLVERFGASPMPIREALQKLQGEGLITIIPHRGACVRPLNKKFITNINEIRTALECMLARKACSRMTSAGLRHLERIQKTYDDKINDMNGLSLVLINLKFHDKIYAYADNPEAVKVLNSQASLIRGLRATLGFDPGRPKVVSSEHHKIIDALRAKDPDKLEKIFRVHCQNALEDYLTVFDKSENLSRLS
ncbi:MAG: GntR family transcriptional regulator [Desulfobulbaceae bacterium]|nr:GntR family transcriptional regulator [Desulfobulbaceae bacterium]